MARFCPISQAPGIRLQHLFLGDTIQPTATLHYLPLHSDTSPQHVPWRPPHPGPASSRPPVLLLSSSPTLLQPHWSHTPKPASSLHSISASQQFLTHSTQLKMKAHSSPKHLSFLLLHFWPDISSPFHRLHCAGFFSFLDSLSKLTGTLHEAWKSVQQNCSLSY